MRPFLRQREIETSYLAIGLRTERFGAEVLRTWRQRLG